MKVVESKNWRAIAASVPGTSHTKQGKPGQDAYHWEILPHNVLVAAVADGAGSAPLGEVGAEVAVNTAVETVATADLTSIVDEGGWELLLTKALEQALAAVLHNPLLSLSEFN